MAQKRKRRKLKKEAIAIFIALGLFIYILLSIPSMLNDNKLSKLGFDEEAITSIRSLNLEEEILKNEYHSDYLNSAISSEGFRKEDLQLYINRTSMSEDEWLLYDTLSDKYSLEERITLFSSLNFNELTPLLVFDDIHDIQGYISDVLNNRNLNANNTFELENQYVQFYENVSPVVNPGSYTMLINKQFQLSDSYQPANLVSMSVQYASRDLQMEATAYESFKQMCNSMKELDLVMYATSTYRSYEYQVNLYTNYANRDGMEAADTYSARGGHSEHQSGLAVDLVTLNSTMGDFGDSPEYEWMVENAHDYGWILRYPEGKESLTGYMNEPWHWRYVGKDIATAVHESKLTYDEYYLLYLN